MRTFPNFDPAWAAQLAGYCAGAYADYLKVPPDELTQVDQALTADVALDCACVTYALGAELDEVRRWLARAAYALGQVFIMRGTTPGMPVAVIDETGQYRDAVAPAADQSLTNSRRGWLAMTTALTAGDVALAEQIAPLVGDPPDASYVGPDSEVCTPDDQALAYALKAFLLGQLAVAIFHLGGLSARAPAEMRSETVAIYTLIDQDRDGFLRALDQLVQAHAAEAARADRTREPRRFLCLPALAIASLAVSAGLLALEDLPDTSVFFPRALLAG